MTRNGDMCTQHAKSPGNVESNHRHRRSRSSLSSSVNGADDGQRKDGADTQLSVLTYNVWGLATKVITVSELIDERIELICKQLEQQAPQWDVILLQEVWDKVHRDRLKTLAAYPFVIDLENYGLGVLPDCGLMILSKYPVSQGHRLTYEHNGMLRRIFENGEYLASKGAIFARMAHPVCGDVWIGNTHLVTDNSDEGGSSYAHQRKEQLATFVAHAKTLSNNLQSAIVVGGDLNTTDQALSLPGFISNITSSAIAPSFSRTNSWNLHKTVFHSMTIDAVFASSHHFTSETRRLAFTLPHCDTKRPCFNLSDHFAVGNVFGVIK